jgi:hypothetical protein
MVLENVGAHLYYSACKAPGIEKAEKRHAHTHTHTPKPVCEHKYVTVLWYRGYIQREKLTEKQIRKSKTKEKTVILLNAKN